MPRYFMRTAPQYDDTPGTPPTPEMMERMGAFIEESFRNGTLIATGSLDPNATKIEHRDGRFTLTDGPFTEAKEAIVGWALIEVGSKDEAIEQSKRFWDIVGDGVGFIQRVHDPDEIRFEQP